MSLPGALSGGPALASTPLKRKRAERVSEPQEHGVKPDQAQRLAVELAHLAEHVGLLDPLDDLSVVDPDVVEEACLKRSLGGRRPVQPPGRRPAD